MYLGTDPPLIHGLNPSWETGKEWSVEVTLWPERLRNPYSESPERIKKTWDYRILKPKGNRSNSRVVVADEGSRFLLEFNKTKNLMNVSEILMRDGDLYKLRNVLRSPTEGRAFLPRNWKPDTPVFWIHPDLSQRQAFVRYNYTRGGRSTQSWMIQSQELNDDTYRIELRHKPSSTRALFYWEEGAVFWKEAVYFRRERLVLRARRVDN